MVLDFPKFLWAEAKATSVYLYNRTLHRMIEYQSLIELHDGSLPPMVSHLYFFGYRAYVHIPNEARPSGSRLQPRAIEGIFVGYAESSKFFQIYIPSKRTVQVTRQVKFPNANSGEATLDPVEPSQPKDLLPSPPPSKVILGSTTSPSEPLPSNLQTPVSPQIPGAFIETSDSQQPSVPMTPFV
ncbi:hypothetical protein K3495_g6675 [Podosphaera aphanis]|nr:hypothetical protein K3495_g6675 [Podosphaera aphanis]